MTKQQQTGKRKGEIKDFFRLSQLAEEFAKIGLKMQFPKISGDKLKEKIIERWNLNNLQEQWERQKLLKKL